MRFDPTLTPDTFDAVDALLDNTFPGDFESKLAKKLRAGGAMTAEHGLWDGASLIGYVAYSPVSVDGCTTSKTLLGLGPMAIASSQQGNGIGLDLLKQSVAATNADGVILLGHVGFYKHAGFGPAANFGLHFSDNPEMEAAFMALEVSKGAFHGVSGRIVYHSSFYEG